MTKRTIVLLNEKAGWVAGGQDGTAAELQEWSALALDESTTVESIAKAVGQKIAELKLPKRNVILVLGPSYLEYRPFQIPPVGAKELPAITQMLARTQLTQSNEDSIFDFAKMPNSSSQGTAQAFIGSTTQKTNLLLGALKEKGLVFSRILPRTTALGLLHNDPSDRQFWISVLPGEVDVFVSGLDQLLLVRSSILPLEGEVRAKTLRREVSRTLAVLSAEYGASSHRRIEVAGKPEDSEVVQSVFREAEAECHQLRPDQIGKTCNLPVDDQAVAVIALATLAEKHPALLDFANPTRPPKDSESTRKLVLVGAALATAIFCLLGYAWLQLRRIDQKIAAVKLEVAALETGKAGNEKLVSDVGKINRFVRDDAGVLEILTQLSEKFPYGDEIRLSKLQIGKEGINNDSDSYPVVMESMVAGKGMENYREIMKTMEQWTTQANPVQDLSVKTKSKIYSEGVTDRMEYSPDFYQRFEQFEKVYFNQEEASANAVVTEETVTAEDVTSDDANAANETGVTESTSTNDSTPEASVDSKDQDDETDSSTTTTDSNESKTAE